MRTFFLDAECMLHSNAELIYMPCVCTSNSFTTIDPNIGYGFIEKQLPPQVVATTDGDPTHHEIEITIKDVAGLVPGAWKGVGKGNRFLVRSCLQHERLTFIVAVRSGLIAHPD